MSCHAQDEPAGASASTIRADRVLILGNSMTLHGVAEQIGWPLFCGMAASAPEKDYVHLVAAGIEERTGKPIRLSAEDTEEPGPDGTAIAVPRNVLNVADTLERQYATYANDALRPQLDSKPDIVVIQIGENTPMETFDGEAFTAALRTLMEGLKASSDPCIFVTSQILREGGQIDEIKRRLIAEDPEHRFYVDLAGFGQNPANFASAEPHYTGIIVGHPGDKGMETIANAILKAIDEAATDR
jgi:alpha-galactosidase